MYINSLPGFDMKGKLVFGFVLWVSVWVLFLKDDFGVAIDGNSTKLSSVDL